MNDQSVIQATTVGILGGMGPAATVDFYSKLIEATPAATDQEHLRVVIWADPTVPDRSQAIAGGGEDPTPKLAEGAQRLKEAGASFYAVACNGAHAFLPAVREQVDLEYLSLIDVTANHIAALPHAKQAGLLATDATLQSQLYQKALDSVGITPVIPTSEDQQVVMDSIYAVKGSRMSDDQRAALAAVANRLVNSGADVIVAGCTEIPLALSDEESARPLIDPARLLAIRVVQEASLQQKEFDLNLETIDSFSAVPSGFRDDPLALAKMVNGTWDRLPPEKWRLDWSAPLDGLNQRSLRKAGSGFLHARTLRRVQAQLKLAAKHPEKFALITSDTANVPRSTAFGVLRVPDLGAARDTMAVASRHQYRGKVVAVTGSVGKTTVRRMLDTTLMAHHSVHTSRRSYNGIRVLRDQLLSLNDRDYATFEVARIALPGGEDLARPDVAVIGALAEAHMEDLGSVKDIARIKAQLLKGVSKTGTGVINIDSPHVDEVLQIAEQQEISTITYGQHAEADIRLVNYDPKSAACQVHAFDREVRYQISAPGRHNAVNSLAVLGVLIALKLPVATYLEALSSFTPVRGRGMTHQVSVDDKSVTVVDESYNANPTSMRAALQGFGDNYPDLRKLLVLGDMLELGPGSPEFHAGLASDVLSLSPEFVVVVGPQMRELYKALPETQPALHIEDADQLGTRLVNQLQDGDAVFVKASLGMRLRGVVDDLVSRGGRA